MVNKLGHKGPTTKVERHSSQSGKQNVVCGRIRKRIYLQKLASPSLQNQNGSYTGVPKIIMETELMMKIDEGSILRNQLILHINIWSWWEQGKCTNIDRASPNINLPRDPGYSQLFPGHRSTFKACLGLWLNQYVGIREEKEIRSLIWYGYE